MWNVRRDENLWVSLLRRRRRRRRIDDLRGLWEAEERGGRSEEYASDVYGRGDFTFLTFCIKYEDTLKSEIAMNVSIKHDIQRRKNKRIVNVSGMLIDAKPSQERKPVYELLKAHYAQTK